jgi:L-threonylcarbamoyladenylate synthase
MDGPDRAGRTLRDRRSAVRLLRKGGILLMPTDTLPGLHGRADRSDTVARVSRLKGRHPERPLLVLCSTTAEGLALSVELSDIATGLIKRSWPGPFTFILKAGEAAPAPVCTESGTIAVRVPDREALTCLIAEVGMPLFSTSVNRFGEPPSADMATAVRSLGAVVDGIWYGQASASRRKRRLRGAPRTGGPSAVGRPSALIDLTVWPPRVLRPGPLALPVDSSGP